MLAVTTDIYNKTIEFPIEEKIQLINKLLIDISPIDSNLEKQWIQEAEHRLKRYKQGKVKAISSQKVFDKINDKYNYGM